MDNQYPLNGNVIVVIGGTTGIGLAGAKACVKAGAQVVALGHDENTKNEAQTALGEIALSETSLVIIDDIRNPNVAENTIDKAITAFGGFHGLYHVAGGSGRRWGDGPLHELSDEGWQKTLELNLTSVMHSNRAAVRKFLEFGQGGVILNVGSVIGTSPSPKYFGTLAYATAKGAIESFTKSAAAFYARHNIRLNVIAPALTETPMSQRAMNNEEIMQYAKSKQPLDDGRVGTPSDLDAAVVYFLSNQSHFVTGQTLAVDGGWSITEGQHPTDLE